MKKLKQILSGITIACMIVTLTPVTAMAAESQGANPAGLVNYETEEIITDIPGADELPDNDELFAGYVEKTLYGLDDAQTFRVLSREQLTENEKKMYDLLKEKIEGVAADGGSTEFQINEAELGIKLSGVTANDLNISGSLIVGGKFVNGIEESIDKYLDIKNKRLLDALLVDCPYDLYWFDKSVEGAFGYVKSYKGDSNAININVTYTLKVAGTYQNGNDTTAKNVGESVTKAKETAAKIVSDNASKSDYEKLVAYRQAICDLVSYNQDAVGTNWDSNNKDPWQLIYVFDGDPDTNVVCEGYSKAFQYLCDLTSFNGGVECYIVSGEMSGGTGAGGHMWNIVTLDGNNYLVDVTNCDGNSVGAPDKLFLAGSTGSTENGYNYTFKIDNLNTIHYKYDTDIIWDNNVLTLSPANYDPDANKLEGSVTVSGEVIFGKTLTAQVEITDQSVGEDKLFYQWYRGNDRINGATNREYTIDSAEDVGKAISVYVTASGYNGTLSAVTETDVAKAACEVEPEFPTVEGTENSITVINIKTNQEYAIAEEGVNPVNWQDSGEFKNLVLGKQYDVYTRIKATDTHEASAPISINVTVKPDKPEYTGTVETPVCDATQTTITVKNPPAGYEYAISDSPNETEVDWTSANPNGVFEELSAGTNYYLFARVSETDEYQASKPIYVIITTLPSETSGKAEYIGDGPVKPELTITQNRIEVKNPPAGYEYIISTTSNETSIDWTSTYANPNGVFENLTANTKYYIFARVAETETHKASNAVYVEATTLSSGSGGSSSSGGGGGSSSNNSNSSATIPVSGGNSSVNVSASVSGSTAAIGDIKTSELDKIAGGDKETMVEIDSTALNKNIDTVKMKSDSIKAIAQAAASASSKVIGLSIKLETCIVEFNDKALEAIAAQSGANDIQLKVENIGTDKLNTAQKEAVKNMDIQGGYEITLTGGSAIVDFNNGTVTAKIPFSIPSGKQAEGFFVIHVADNGTVTKMPTSYENGYLKFSTDHFSKYMISYSEDETEDNKPTEPNNPSQSLDWETLFSDVSRNAWYYDAVKFVSQNNLMNGVADNTFAPASNLSRAMLAQILYNKEGKPAAGTSAFTDVTAGQWYADAVSWATANGVVNGLGNNMFGPNNNITREQLAVMLYRYADSPAVTGSVTGFSDADRISSFATDAMAWATTNGIMNGKGDGRLDPKGLATRAEVAQMIKNYLDK